MKNGVLILLSGLLGVLLLAIVMTVGGNMSRSVELQENMSGAVEGAVREAMNINVDMCTDEMIAEFITRMAAALDAEMGVELRIYQADAEKGIFSLRAVGDYLHPNGMRGETMWERTVIYEQREEMEGVKACEVRFYESKEALLEQEDCYKVVTVMSGSRIVAPAGPQKDALTFGGWVDSNDYIADFSQGVEQDISYYAAWE